VSEHDSNEAAGSRESRRELQPDATPPNKQKELGAPLDKDKTFGTRMEPDESLRREKKTLLRKTAAPGFIWRNATIGLSIAIAAWLTIMGVSFLATRVFLIPLAIILGLAIVPIFITSGYTHDA
jgi:hypothetical protein